MMFKIEGAWINLIEIVEISKPDKDGIFCVTFTSGNTTHFEGTEISSDQLAEKINKYRAKVLHQSRTQIQWGRSGNPLP